MLELIETDGVDVAFSLIAAELPDGVAALALSEEEVVAAYPPGKAPDQAAVDAAELADRPLATPRAGSAIKHAADEFFADAGYELHSSLESGDPFLIRCLVSDGFGAAILPASLARRAGPAGRDAGARAAGAPAGRPCSGATAATVPRPRRRSSSSSAARRSPRPSSRGDDGSRLRARQLR